MVVVAWASCLQCLPKTQKEEPRRSLYVVHQLDEEGCMQAVMAVVAGVVPEWVADVGAVADVAQASEVADVVESSALVPALVVVAGRELAALVVAESVQAAALVEPADLALAVDQQAQAREAPSRAQAVLVDSSRH
jgi:hypothetical protein